jgi:hypothetical protein
MARDVLLTTIADRIEHTGGRGFSCFWIDGEWRVTPRTETGWGNPATGPTIADAIEAAFTPRAVDPTDYNASVVIHDDDDDGLDLV